MAVAATLLGCGEDGRPGGGWGGACYKAPVATYQVNGVKAGEERSLVRGFQH